MSFSTMKTDQMIPNDRIVFEEIIPGGGMWSYALLRNYTLRLTALGDGANVGAMFYNRDHFLDRLNLPDTLKAQHTAKLTTGHVLFSDMGHVLCSITSDSCGWNDPLGGHMNASDTESKYGVSSFQEARNAFHKNARDQFLIELGKWGLGKADLVANVNFFSKVTADIDGKIHYSPGHSVAGDYLDLRAELNVLVVMNSCQHPMDPNPVYAPQQVKLTVWRSTPPTADDLCRISRPENERGFILTEALFKR
jgi:urea carboxylase-associated protein 2